MGLLLGLGFVVKYVVLFDAIAAFAILAIHTAGVPSRRERAVSAVKLWLALGAALAGPFLLVMLLYRTRGHFAEFWFANFTANRARTIGGAFRSRSLRTRCSTSSSRTRSFGPVCPWPWSGLRRATDAPADRTIIGALLLWMGIVLAGMILVFRRSFYEHYFLQLGPARALISAWVLVRVVAALKVGRAEPAARRARLALFGHAPRLREL